MPHTGEDPEQLELSYIADGNSVWHTYPGKVSYLVKHILAT